MGERISYSKTVQDATFMRMKNDETLSAYNLQIGTENGFETGVSVHQSANDGKVFIELMEKCKAQTFVDKYRPEIIFSPS